MNMPVSLITVTCTTCGHEQNEPMGAISTVCGKCHTYIAVDKHIPAKGPEAPKRTRVVVCPYCERSQKIYPQALSIMCVECGVHVKIANHTVVGQSRHSLDTFGEVTFVRGCRYSGAEVRAQVIHASGSLQTRLHAFSDLIFNHRSDVSGPVTAGNILVQPGAKVHARRMTAEVFTIKGYLHAEAVHASRMLIVEAGGYLAAQSIKAAGIEVHKGGGVEGHFESIPLPAGTEAAESAD